jgi:hypothetical protein
MIKASLEACLAELKIDLLARCKDIRHVVDILYGFNVVNGYATVTLYEFHIPDNTVLGGQDPDVSRLASTLGE